MSQINSDIFSEFFSLLIDITNEGVKDYAYRNIQVYFRDNFNEDLNYNHKYELIKVTKEVYNLFNEVS